MIAFAQGDGIEQFRPENVWFAKRSMIVSVGTEGPSTEARRVGVSGGVSPRVARVAIERVDGVVLDLDLVAGPVGTTRFFGWLTDSPSTVPSAVRAYDAAGRLVAQEDLGWVRTILCVRNLILAAWGSTHLGAHATGSTVERGVSPTLQVGLSPSSPDSWETDRALIVTAPQPRPVRCPTCDSVSLLHRQ
jgi:hypothetical protein